MNEKKGGSAIKDMSDINSQAGWRENETGFRVKHNTGSGSTLPDITHTHAAPEPWVSSLLPGRA